MTSLDNAPVLDSSSLQRLDQALVSRDLVRSRSRAKALILEHGVWVDGVQSFKPDLIIASTQRVELVALDSPWVSRGAFKLISVLDHFNISVVDQHCLDVGCSTGGFTQVLLARNARGVLAIDVGRQQCVPEIANDERVTLWESTDIRHITRKDLANIPTIAVVDVSFISLTLVLPAILGLVASHATLVCLIKPQFEVGMGGTKKGIVVSESDRMRVVQSITQFLIEAGCGILGVIPSPIAGGSGNVEYLIGVECPEYRDG